MTDFYAVIGKPVAHSKSPLMFNSFFKSEGIDAYYSRIASENHEDALETCKLLGIKGINITMPYKKELLQRVDFISKEARDVEGVNTLVLGKQLKGFNTDIFGALMPLKKTFGNLENKKILVIGAGGAARAALYAYKKEGAICYLANRSVAKGKYVAKKYNAFFLPLAKINSVLKDMDAVVYTIPVKIDLNISLLSSNAVFFTAIYKQHFFKKECEHKFIKYISGEEWLIEQGKVSCSIFGFNCEKTSAFKPINGIKTPDRIALIGFMGSGKTSVGKELAEKLNYHFIDLDKEIEKGERTTIPDIFNKYGEHFFRKLEQTYLQKFLEKEKIIVATGGGIVNTEKCFELLKQYFYNIYLCGEIKDFFKRTEYSERPMRTDFKSFVSLFEKRKENYFKLSDLIVNTSYKEMNKISGIILYEICKL